MKTFFGTEIPKRTSKCSNGEDFLNGEEVFSFLSYQESEFIRKDFCHSCWNKIEDVDAIESFITSWKSIFSKEEEKELHLDANSHAIALLKTVATSQDLEDLQVAYILCLYLMRKKIIFCRKEFTNDQQECFFLMETAEQSENIIVKKFATQNLDIPSLQKIIAAKLKSQNIFFEKTKK